MGFDNQLFAQGSISTDGGNFTTDGVKGNVTAAGTLTVTGAAAFTAAVKAGILQQVQATGTVQTLVNTNTITVAANQSSVRVTAAGAVTGIILAAGTLAGQILTVIHEGAAANTLTMAAAGTSNVAAGVTCVLSGLASHIFVWDNITALWYQVGPAAN